MDNFKHITSIQKRYNDYDILGHVNNAVYQHYYDLAKMEYFSEVLGQNLIGNKYTLVMASLKTDYILPIEKDDEINIRTTVHNIGNKSISLKQEIVDYSSGVLKSKSESTLVCYSIEEKNTTELPEIWQERIFAFEGKELKSHSAN